jgi:hypothetical protein
MIATHPRILGVVLLTSLMATAGRASGQVGVTLQWVYPVETVYVSDLTPYGEGNHPDFLAITLTEGTGRPQTIGLEIRVLQESPAQRQMFLGNTDPFLLEGVRRLTNRDLTRKGNDVVIEDYEVGDVDALVQTGRLPAGTYLFTATARGAGGVALGSGDLRLVVGAPTRIDPLGPGTLVGDAPLIVTTPSPRFMWSTDGVSSGMGSATYTLRVVRADGAGSAEEAMQGFASWQTVTTQTSVIYPGSAEALPLEAGATYAWQVTREVRSTDGVERIESPIYWFTMAASASGNTGVGAAADRAMRSRLEQLYRSLGLTELMGYYKVTGLRVDGRAMPIDGVEELLAAIAAGEVPLISLRVR